MKFTYKHTVYACFTGYVVQAIVNNFVPLLFLMFQSEYHVSLDRIALLITVNFGVQIATDLISAKLIDRIGYRIAAIAAHIASALGLIGLTILPVVIPNAYVGLLIAVVIYAIGGGLIEVLISPIVEACPSDNKEAAMSLLHSFYCWGHVGVVLVSTIFFAWIGIAHWRYLAVFWALIPIANTYLFAKVPILTLEQSQQEGTDGSEKGAIGIRKLFTLPMFWLMILLMICAGASEQSVSQWASAFAEAGLGVSKTIGDLAGPMMFACLMGLSRTIYAKFSEKIKLERFMMFSALLCMASYLMISLTKIPALGLIGCALCGFSVGIMWPGTFSVAVKKIPGGGTAMFAFFALAGDIGCGGGPTFVGLMSSVFGDDLKKGILCAIVFPILLFVGVRIVKASNNNSLFSK